MCQWPVHGASRLMLLHMLHVALQWHTMTYPGDPAAHIGCEPAKTCEGSLRVMTVKPILVQRPVEGPTRQ